MNFFKKINRHHVFAFLLGMAFFSLAFTLIDSEKYKAWFTESYKVKSPYLPVDLDFAGEKIPVKDPDINERLDREIMATVFWQSNTMMLMKRSKKYFPVIEPILKEYGIPSDFKYLCVAESGLTNVTSPAGAKGFWQLMESSVKRYNIEINEFVDERYNLEKATRAACMYLKESYASLNNWTLSAASYNRGLPGTTRDMSFQGVDTYYDLYMNDETARYIYRIMAYKLIFENPEMYGFYLKPEDYYSLPAQRVVIVDSAINSLSDFAKQKGSNYKMLKMLNPWLRDRSLPNKSRKQYQILLPSQ